MLSVIAKMLLRTHWESLRADALALSGGLSGQAEKLNCEMIHKTLVVAEDRRFYDHGGIDTKAMLRALFLFAIRREIQGASTITQQLVRVLTKRYERTARRKIREILLATLLDKEISKDEQIACYLDIAYFGWRMNGLRQALLRQGFTLPLKLSEASQIIARLKYPEPQFASPSLMQKIAARANHIEYLVACCEESTHEIT